MLEEQIDETIVSHGKDMEIDCQLGPCPETLEVEAKKLVCYRLLSSVPAE